MTDNLISRSAAKDEILSWAVCLNKPHLLSRDDTMYVLDTLPAVDAVEVVRCKDCKYYDYGKRFPDIKFCCRLKDKDGEIARYNYSDEDFCSYGERRADDGK